ncbi:CMP-sialic acid transporter 5-like [Olea europaea var. sylvestris]|uniref:CMP-sialic acid transporter 5-like n=1 Tax=Olea europaea var. sylvestris TaxID=158386 RepID=UPI000C1D37AE|nr:CMP-sialic acid transporter 5-like [Olea europaea var. sylvestris]
MEATKLRPISPNSSTSTKVWLFSLLLTIQYGAQPLISKRFTRREVIVTSSVLACEVVKVVCASILMAKDGTLKRLYKEWTLIGSLTASGLPAAIYALQNSAYKSPDGTAIRQRGFFDGWTPLTLIPVSLNAVGGILVGLVTSYAGGVRKGFVIVSALLVTALLQFVFDGKPPSPYCLVAFPLVITSISIYQKYPYRLKKKDQ